MCLRLDLRVVALCGADCAANAANQAASQGCPPLHGRDLSGAKVPLGVMVARSLEIYNRAIKPRY